MADIYYYLQNSKLNDCLKFGIKLSDYFNDEIEINNTNRKYLLGFLNPKDDLEKFNSNEYTCIRTNINNDYLFVTDSILLSSEYFEENLIPIERYKFGTFRNPIVLILSSILSNQINIINKIIDIPVLYNSSEELYLKNSIEYLRETISDEVLLEHLLNLLSNQNIITKISLPNGKIIYQDKNNKMWT